MKVVVFRR